MSDWRDPCPWRIIEDVGGAYALGFYGGCIFATAKGAYTAPPGIKARLKGAWSNCRIRAPRYGVSFAAWGLAFSSCECTMIWARQREDPINTITSGAVTGAILAARQGKAAMGVSAVFGGLILGVIEGTMAIVNKYQIEGMKSDQERQQKEFMEYAEKKAKDGQIGTGWGGVENVSKHKDDVKALD